MGLLLIIEKVGTFTRAAQIMGIPYSCVSQAKKKYPAVANAIYIAELRYSSILVDTATDLAVNGWQEEVYGKGKDGSHVLVGTKTKRDARLLETLLAANVSKFKRQTANQVQAQKMEIHLNFGDGSKDVVDGTTGESIADNVTVQLESSSLSTGGVDVHDERPEGIEEQEL